MSILASVCWKAGSVWLCCGRVCGSPRVVACWFGARVCARVRVVAWSRVPACACVLAGLACARAVCPRVWVCARVVACVCVWSRACASAGLARVWVCVGGRACVRGPPSGVLWRFPTLPHPLGCSTIGAAGLSFQVRNVAGRFPGAVTTTRLCRPPVLARGLVGWVGGGLVVVRIVVAASSCPPLLPCLGPCLRARRGWGVSGCPSPPPCCPCSLFGAGGPLALLVVAVLAVWGVGAGVGGVGVVSAH